MKFNKLIAKAAGLLLLLFLFQGQAQAQNVRYVCYNKTVCSNKPVQVKRFSLSNLDTVYRSNDSGICYVSRLGTYNLLSTEIDTGIELPKIKFTSFGDFKDTVQSWSMYTVLVHGYTENLETGDWLCCDKKCDGYKIDYYKNGQKRVEGEFKKGRPVGQIKYYNDSGHCTQIVKYNKKGEKIGSLYLGN